MRAFHSIIPVSIIDFYTYLGEQRSVSSKISEDNPTLAIPLPDGTYLRAVGYPTDTYPCIDIYWDNGINAPTDTLCFVEFNPNHEEDERVCIGAYRSNQDDPTYYAPYMAAERNANNE